MVKKQFFLFLFPLLIGCNEKVVEQMNEMIMYKNYLESDTIPFDISKSFDKVSVDTFDARSIQKKYKLKEIEGYQKKNLLLKYAECIDEFSKVRDGDEYVSKLKEFEQVDSYKIHAVTTIIHKNSIVSYVILIRTLNTLEKIPFNCIILLNTKDNKLCSIVEIAYGIENSENLTPVLRAYKTGNAYLAITDPIYPGMTKDYSLWKVRSKEDLLIALGIKDEHKTVILYSIFYIDTTGFIKFTKIDDNNLLKVLK